MIMFGEEGEYALRYRNYAEELRLIASDKSVPETRASLLKVANDYDRLASACEAVDKSKRTSGLPPRNSA